MKSLLMKLYDGEICPREETEPILKEYRKKLKEADIYEMRFVRKLDKELIGDFNDFLSEYYELTSAGMAEAFAKGFSVGVKMMAEASYLHD